MNRPLELSPEFMNNTNNEEVEILLNLSNSSDTSNVSNQASTESAEKKFLTDLEQSSKFEKLKKFLTFFKNKYSSLIKWIHNKQPRKCDKTIDSNSESKSECNENINNLDKTDIVP